MMFSKLAAVVINCIFGFLFCQSVIIAITAGIMSADGFSWSSNGSSAVFFFIFCNIVLIGLDIAYNIVRAKKHGINRFFWLSIFVPIIVIGGIMTAAILLFF